MSDKYDKYKLRRQVTGRLNLADPIQEAAIHLLAHSTPNDDICAILKITPEQLIAFQADPLAQKRLAYKKEMIAKKQVRPKTPDECLEFAKLSLVNLSKTADSDKTKVDALKALASVAIDERKNKPSESPLSERMNDALQRLTEK